MTDKNTCLTHQALVLPSYRNQSIHLLCKSVGWFLNGRLNKTKKREIHEDRSHSYYYQIQLQLFVTVFFTYGLHRTCIRMPDETFWEIALPKSEVSLWTASFQNLLENFIQGSRKKNVSSVTNGHTVLEAVFCSFKKRGFGTMIECDNIQCTVDWVVPYSLFKSKTYYRLATPNGRKSKQNSQAIKLVMTWMKSCSKILFSQSSYYLETRTSQSIGIWQIASLWFNFL